MKEKLSPEIQEVRTSEFPIHPLLLSRWSPRAMSGEEMSMEELMPLFEAARWAPSSYNAQPWRFIYTRRNTPSWEKFLGLLVAFNQSWAKNAAALVVVASHKVFEHNQKGSVTHSFDTGAAWENLALEATHRGYVAHGMEGFDYQKASQVCALPPDYQVEAMIAIGKKGKKDILPAEIQKREAPSPRKPLSEIVMEGKYK